MMLNTTSGKKTMSKLKKINRKLKSAMKIFIKHEDESALRGVENLIKERRIIQENLLKDLRHNEN